MYDGDGRRVAQTVNGVTTYFVGNHYEVTNGVVTKYYFAGATRLAVRTNGTLSYMLSDHLGSTSLITNASGNVTSEMRYSAWGEVRYQAGVTPTNYTYTGQYSNVSDFGLMFYGSRWYDGSLGRFAQADTIVPGGVQGYDRYAYANNNPIRYTDPSGHSPRRSDYRNQIHANKMAESNRRGEAENLLDMLMLAFAGVDAIYLVGDALELIQNDPRFLEFQSQIVFEALSKSGYGEIDFNFSEVAEYGITFGGSRDPASMLMQFLDPHNPMYSETQAVGSSELTWMLRHANVSVDVHVSKNGQITLSYTLTDQFDLTPDWENRSLEYNIATYFLGSVWHGTLDASKPYVYANWTTVVNPWAMCWGLLPC